MRVLLATDGSPAAQDAEWLLMRMPFRDAVEIVIATVTYTPDLAELRDKLPPAVTEMVQVARERSTALLTEEAVRFDGVNGTVETVLLDGHPAEELVKLAAERRCDLVILGARGLSPTQRFLLGSVSHKVAKQASCSALVTRPLASREQQHSSLRVLTCLDGSSQSQTAVEQLAAIEWGDSVEMTLITVLPTLKEYGTKVYERSRPVRDLNHNLAQQWHQTAMKDLAACGCRVESRIVESAHVADQIVDLCEEGQFDLVVLGHRGMSRVQEFLLGSTSESVLRHAPCSVWIVRGGSSSPQGD